MKQKNGSSQVVTKAYLDKVLEDKFGFSDVKTDLKLENLERKIDEKAQQYRDQILTSNDKLAKTLETMLKIGIGLKSWNLPKCRIAKVSFV